MSTLAPIHARPDTTALLMAHAALRGEFARLAEACRAPGAEALRAGIAAHVALMLDLLHVHHEAEEDVLLPALSGAAPHLRPGLAGLAARRAALAVPVARVRVGLTGPLDRLAPPLEQLAEAVRTHLDAQEELCVDAIRTLLPLSAWERFDEARRWRVPPALRSRAAGVVLSYGSPEQLARVRATDSPLPDLPAFRALRAFRAVRHHLRSPLAAHHRRMRGVYGHLAAAGAGR
ncbi:hemerythrin domain-containing protein [Kitasatospora sp. NPDC057512]|uniref:hemerythrin domain-containing protein n=1 Tax=Kitasatospora sp. NPDC057512 TaxID=3346154 RepID=UPI003675C75C